MGSRNQMVLAYARQFGLGEYIDIDPDTQKIYPSRKLEEEALEWMNMKKIFFGMSWWNGRVQNGYKGTF